MKATIPPAATENSHCNLNGAVRGIAPKIELVKRRRFLLMAGGALAGVGLVSAGSAPYWLPEARRLAHLGREAVDSTTVLYANPAQDVWPEEVRQLPAVIQEVYRYAAANHDVLQFIPCFCGCADLGHPSNFGCYVREVYPDGRIRVNTHSFDCAVCAGVTRDVIEMRSQGVPLKAIRATVDMRWSGSGPSTNTPLPPG